MARLGPIRLTVVGGSLRDFDARRVLVTLLGIRLRVVFTGGRRGLVS